MDVFWPIHDCRQKWLFQMLCPFFIIPLDITFHLKNNEVLLECSKFVVKCFSLYTPCMIIQPLFVFADVFPDTIRKEIVKTIYEDQH